MVRMMYVNVIRYAQYSILFLFIVRLNHVHPVMVLLWYFIPSMVFLFYVVWIYSKTVVCTSYSFFTQATGDCFLIDIWSSYIFDIHPVYIFDGTHGPCTYYSPWHPLYILLPMTIPCTYYPYDCPLYILQYPLWFQRVCQTTFSGVKTIRDG